MPCRSSSCRWSGERSTYQETLLRVADAELFAPPIVITGADFRFFARRQAEDLGIDATVVIEPMRRDSGPAVAAAAALARSRDPDAVVLALAADHVILDVEEFRATCLAGLKAAQAGHIVTFGITPTAPKTSYGYIRRGAADRRRRGSSGRGVRREAGRRDRGALCRRGLSVELGQFPVPRRRAAGGARALTSPRWREAAEAAVARAASDLGFVRLEPEAFAQRAAEVDRLCGDGEDRPRRGGRRQVPLVRHRLLGRDLRHRRARQVRQRDPRHGGDVGCAQLRGPFRSTG